MGLSVRAIPPPKGGNLGVLQMVKDGRVVDSWTTGEGGSSWSAQSHDHGIRILCDGKVVNSYTDD